MGNGPVVPQGANSGPDEAPDQIRSHAMPADASIQGTAPSGQGICAEIPPWTPLSATVSGPKFLSLSSADQGKIRKLHRNLGHPTSEKLARHLAEMHTVPQLVEGCPRLSVRIMRRETCSSEGNTRQPEGSYGIQ